MSCRVISRTAEECLFNAVVEQARGHGYRSLVGVYSPTPKNGLVKDLYDRMGFVRRATADGADVTYDYDLPGGPIKTHVRVRQLTTGNPVISLNTLPLCLARLRRCCSWFPWTSAPSGGAGCPEPHAPDSPAAVAVRRPGWRHCAVYVFLRLIPRPGFRAPISQLPRCRSWPCSWCTGRLPLRAAGSAHVPCLRLSATPTRP
jgi:hypothetical protein